MRNINPFIIGTYIDGAAYPADKRALVDAADQDDADADVLTAISTLPDRTYRSPMDVIEELGSHDYNF